MQMGIKCAHPLPILILRAPFNGKISPQNEKRKKKKNLLLYSSVIEQKKRISV